MTTERYSLLLWRRVLTERLSELLRPRYLLRRYSNAIGMERINARWAYGIIALLVALAIVQIMVWFGRGGRQSFPRHPSEFLSAEQLDRRLHEFSVKLSQNPDDAYALMEAGMLHYQKGGGFYIEAINELFDAWDRGALDDRIFYYLGVMYQEEGLPLKAVESFQKFLRNRPEDKEVRMLLAKLFYQDGRFQESVDQYLWLYDRYPRDPIVEENLGLTLLKLERRDEARKAFESLIQKGTVHARRAHFYLGQIEMESKQYEKAREHFLAVMPGHPDLGIQLDVVYAAIAANYEQLNSLLPAKENWEKTLQYNPQNSQARKSLRPINAALKKAAREAAQKRAQSEREAAREAARAAREAAKAAKEAERAAAKAAREAERKAAQVVKEATQVEATPPTQP